MGGGIRHYKLCAGELTPAGEYPLDRPMFLCFSPDGGRLYILLRAPFEDSPFSGLVSCTVRADGSLSDFTAPASTGGLVACHLWALEGAWALERAAGDEIYAVNYLSGNLVRMNAAGEITAMAVHSGRGPHPTRQEAPHTHFVSPTPDGRALFCVDLGLDTVFLYDRNLKKIGGAKVPAGEGCRHLAVSPDGRWIYVVNELGSSVTVMEYRDRSLIPGETFPALPADFRGQSTAGAIRLSEDGRILFLSHRGHDSVTAFSVHGPSLTDPVTTPLNGSSPRDFILTDGYLAAACESGELDLLEMDGRSLIPKASVPLPHPIAVIIRPD